MDPIQRVTSRVLPVSEEGAVLLLLDQDPARPGVLRWGTIGGGVDAGESHEDAAVRELFEETGVVAQPSALGDPFHTDILTYSYDGVAYEGRAKFYAMSLSRQVEVTFAHLEPLEVDNVLEARWLTPEEVRADGRLVAPQLPDIMTAAVAAVLADEKDAS